ncbi:hypothetical protein [Dactylosporangium sp. CS-033363]|uniref:hypothetical protein n=1 Tax=Dactylosporangium sp. CS-033363 TaxID=3239935 RepID=UPI003D948B00
MTGVIVAGLEESPGGPAARVQIEASLPHHQVLVFYGCAYVFSRWDGALPVYTYTDEPPADQQPYVVPVNDNPDNPDDEYEGDEEPDRPVELATVNPQYL